ncbi:hypothetical protein niasHT_025321 [Heterodera trifolii]|uniref:Carboxylic ester hydrolase n=1 Tax=Heterodera trifolii TaxID=157864 RepID=A0ABD2KKJ2_9BILA
MNLGCYFSLFNLIILFCGTFCSIRAEEIIVETIYGKLKGQIHTLANELGQIDTFFGIPFAQAKRFEKPIASQKWEGVRSAVDQPPGCVPHARPTEEGMADQQPISEDCLFLNVFAPHRSPSAEQNKTFPVLVVIHGGAYEIGSSARYTNYEAIGQRFVTDANSRGIVFVSIQYRLGVMGFATTGDEELPGNLGIWDQISALQFVKDNIAEFGGDPSRVTVFGYSAGSGSTALLSISPKSRDLFQQATRMSGTPFSVSGSGTFVAEETKKLANAMGCAANRTKQCLNEKSVEQMFDGMDKIVKHSKRIRFYSFLLFYGPAPLSVYIAKFSPHRLDRELFPQDYPEMIATAPPKKMIMGFAELDFLLFSLISSKNNSISMLALTDEQIANYDQKAFEASVSEFVVKEKYFGNQTNEVKAEIVQFYVNEYLPAETVKDQKFFVLLYTTLLSDLMDVVPTLWEAQIRLASNWPIYLYENVYFNPAQFPKRAIIQAAYHGFDHSLIFYDEFTKKSEEDRKMSDYLVMAIKNFVINGDPSTETIRWDQLTDFSSIERVEKVQHMRMEAKKTGMVDGMKAELKRARFWRELAKKYTNFDLVRGIFQEKSGQSAAFVPSAQFAQLFFIFAIVAIISLNNGIY